LIFVVGIRIPEMEDLSDFDIGIMPLPTTSGPGENVDSRDCNIGNRDSAFYHRWA
jgi:hypothetical protein